jgi:hypothetical protein
MTVVAITITTTAFGFSLALPTPNYVPGRLFSHIQLAQTWFAALNYGLWLCHISIPGAETRL